MCMIRMIEKPNVISQTDNFVGQGRPAHLAKTLACYYLYAHLIKFRLNSNLTAGRKVLVV